MILNGGIPYKITYAVRYPTKVRREWVADENVDIAPPISASPAFAVDAESKAALETALRWAGKEEGEHAQTLTVLNDPIPGVRILTIEARSEGGRAYKVMLRGVGDGTLYVDMREDVVLDAMLVNGVKPGGDMEGPFVWGRYESQLRLVRVHSALHKAMVAAQGRMETPTIKPKDYVVGGIYLTRRLHGLLYLGRCDTDWVDYYKTLEQRRMDRRMDRHLDLIHGYVRNEPLWLDLRYHGGLSSAAQYPNEKARQTEELWTTHWERGYNPVECSVWGLRSIRQPVITKHVTTVPIDWHRLRRAAVDYAAYDAKEMAFHRGTIRDEDYQIALRSSSRLAHLRPAGEPLPVHPEYAALWKKFGVSQE